MAGPRPDRFQRRSARNRVVIIVMAFLMAMSLLAVPLSQMLGG
jgi:hypothetical protein